MDSALIRKHIHKKKNTFIVTIILLLILTVQFYYLNCYIMYFPFYCEMSFMYFALAIIVANVWFYFSGGKPNKTSIKEGLQEIVTKLTKNTRK
jgi:hypothetical protein